MTALTYESLGAINGVTETPKAPASKRSRDKNNIQRLAFKANPTALFSGLIHVQGAVGDPTLSDVNTLWFDIAEMQINEEGGSWSLELEGEFSSIRVVCKAGNYWASTTGNDTASSGTTVGLAGNFTLNGIPVAVAAGNNEASVAATINATAGIAAANIVADVYTDSTVVGALRIYTTDGSDLTIADTTNTPLGDLGFVPGTYSSGSISAIRMLR